MAEEVKGELGRQRWDLPSVCLEPRALRATAVHMTAFSSFFPNFLPLAH